MGRLLTAAVAAAICTTALAAQSTQTAQEKEAQKVPVLTVSGCLRTGDEPGTFVLTSVKWLDKTSAEKSAVGTSGSDADNSGATLRLVGAPAGVRMSEHVGHTVEITGTLVDEVSSEPKAKAEVAQPQPQHSAPPPSQQPAPKSGHTLNVRTIKMIGENCSAR